MTDKPIIIDGVDVSGCEYYCERYCKQVVAEDGCYVFLCAEDENCHYKKWQRKEQECEELKEQLTILDDDDVVVEITVKQFEEYQKLKQTLAEIKEIAEDAKTKVFVDMEEFWELILQKISEVEDVANN